MGSHFEDSWHASSEHPDSIKGKGELQELQVESGMAVPTLASH